MMKINPSDLFYTILVKTCIEYTTNVFIAINIDSSVFRFFILEL